ncbi:phage tail tip lysozyme [Acetobacter pasteurianus]|uniref:phage tail tip lysozyme n=1 Tax=Acetobacter pasteurianus TaxID=438 RepID=UPI0013599D75|nr:phage tail tip lysozyme [Acetobacter pasteurianus]
MPLRNARRNLKRFSDITGMTRMRKGMADLSRSTLNAFRSVGRLVPEMGILTSASSIAGVYKLASAWATFGTNLRTTARSIGMNPGRLMALRNAARLSGGTADAMGGALGHLANLKWEVPNGFAPQAAAQLQAFGIRVEELKKLSPDQMFDRIAKKIRGIKTPTAQAIAVTSLFGEQAAGLLPIFQQSEREFQNNIRLAKRYGVVNKAGADAAARMQKSQQELSLAVEGFGYSIAEAVEPSITGLVHWMAELIAANRKWIAQDLAGYVKRIVTWLQTGGWNEIETRISGVMQRIKSVVDYLGGWKAAAVAAVAGMGALWGAPVLGGIASIVLAISGISAGFLAATAAAGGLLAIIGKLSQTDSGRNFLDGMPGFSWLDDFLSRYTPFGRSYGDQRKSMSAQNLGGSSSIAAGRSIQSFFMRNGYTSEQAAGLVANLSQESGFNPDKPGDNGTAYGMGQWHSDRQADYLRLYHHRMQDVHGDQARDEQLNFMMWELKNRSYLGDSQLRRAGTASQAAAIASVDYFRPGKTQADQLAEMQRRAGLGRDWSSALTPTASLPSASSQGQSPYDKMLLDLHISAKTPAGTTVKATSRSDNLHVASVKQQRAMDPENSSIGN